MADLLFYITTPEFLVILLSAFQIFFTVVFSAGSSFDLWFVGKVKYDPTAATTDCHGVN